MATLLQLRNRVREKSDTVNATDRHTDAQLNQLINDSWKVLYGKLAGASLIRCLKTEVITADGSATYTLPSDFFGVYAVFEENGNRHRRLSAHRVADRPFGRSAISGAAVTYNIADIADAEEIEFYPSPDGGTYVVTYIPVPTALTAEGDTINGVLAWEEWVVLHAAIKVLDRDDLDTSQLERRLAIEEMAIDDAVQARDLLETHHIRDLGCDGYYGSDPADYSPYSRRGGY